ncbi:MAG: hypothetical protein JKY64_03695 [Alcanivorax sp.]|nr:hypothetical protein [Alcanivorax sp.]
MIDMSFLFLGKYVAEIVAVCALGLTLYQAYLLRQHNRLTVRPHLVSFSRRNKTPGQRVLVYSLLNNGVGPAFIKSFRILLDGQLVTDLDKALGEALSGLQYNHSITRLGDEYAMVAGEAKDILVLALPRSNGEAFVQIDATLSRFDLVVEYESAYKESRVLDTRIYKKEQL